MTELLHVTVNTPSRSEMGSAVVTKVPAEAGHTRCTAASTVGGSSWSASTSRANETGRGPFLLTLPRPPAPLEAEPPGRDLQATRGLWPSRRRAPVGWPGCPE